MLNIKDVCSWIHLQQIPRRNPLHIQCGNYIQPRAEEQLITICRYIDCIRMNSNLLQMINFHFPRRHFVTAVGSWRFHQIDDKNYYRWNIFSDFRKYRLSISCIDIVWYIRLYFEYQSYSSILHCVELWNEVEYRNCSFADLFAYTATACFSIFNGWPLNYCNRHINFRIEFIARINMACVCVYCMHSECEWTNWTICERMSSKYAWHIFTIPQPTK